MPARCSGSPTICSSATSSTAGELRTSDGMRDRPAQHQVADHRASARGATTSRRRSRRWAGSPTSTTTRTRSSPTARPSSTRCTRRSAISASSFPARSRPRSMTSSPRCMEMIDLMPPGLYEAVIDEVDEDTAQPRPHPRQVSVPAGAAHASTTSARSAATAPRTTSASPTVARVSEINLGLYRTLAQPVVRAMTTRAVGRGDAADASQPPALRACSPTRTR